MLFAQFIDEAEAIEIKETFQSLDKANRGYVDLDVLRDAMKAQNELSAVMDVDLIVDQMDINQTNTIDYSDFLASALTQHHCT